MPTAEPPVPVPAVPARLRTRLQRFADAAAQRLLKLPGSPAEYTVTRDLRIPARDGVELLADHFAPVGIQRGTILIRSPYGSDTLSAALFAGPYASRGYHVVLARTRGTFGSGGSFEPMVHEVDDGADTVAWLRGQPWFGGRFATLGPSYLGFTQWALLMDPPPELAAAVIQVAPHDFSRAVYAGGAFHLNDFLGWSDLVAHQEEGGFLAAQYRQLTVSRRQAPAMSHLPLAEASDELCEGRAPWYRAWVSNRNLSDPFWARMQLEDALDRVQVPVLLQTGWQDLFLRQTIEQYEHLRGRGIDVALTVGPWVHTDIVAKAASTTIPEALDWLAEHLVGTGSRSRWAPVRIFLTGAGAWHDLTEWPPPTSRRELRPQPGGALGEQPAASGAAPATFTYDPADPTPTIGGRLLSRAGGYRDDSSLAGRADILAFTGPPLASPLEVVGVPVAELAHSTDNPHADLFVRISEVDVKGRSRNVSDGFVRLDPGRADGAVRIHMDPIAHRFAAGHRLRLLIAGGSFPRWERNLGTGEDPASSARTKPSRRSINLAGSRVLLPVRS